MLPGLKGPRNFLMFDCSSVHMSLKPMHHIIFISVKVQFSLNSKIKEGKEKKKPMGRTRSARPKLACAQKFGHDLRNAFNLRALSFE